MQGEVNFPLPRGLYPPPSPGPQAGGMSLQLSVHCPLIPPRAPDLGLFPWCP